MFYQAKQVCLTDIRATYFVWNRSDWIHPSIGCCLKTFSLAFDVGHKIKNAISRFWSWSSSWGAIMVISVDHDHHHPVWPDFPKFSHFGENYKSCAIFWGIILQCLENILNLLWQKLLLFGKVYWVENGQNWKHNTSIWTHCGNTAPVPHIRDRFRTYFQTS